MRNAPCEPDGMVIVDLTYSILLLTCRDDCRVADHTRCGDIGNPVDNEVLTVDDDGVPFVDKALDVWAKNGSICRHRTSSHSPKAQSAPGSACPHVFHAPIQRRKD